MRRAFLTATAIMLLALSVAACGQSETEACKPYGGVAQWDGEEGFCNDRDANGDRIEIEKSETIGEGVVVDFD